MNLWFISDTHFGHRNIATTFVQEDGTPARPFASVTEMDEVMIDRWNAVVKPPDHIYHLGDVSMVRGKHSPWLAGLLTRLHGHKRLLLGNHDALPAAWYLAHGFEKLFASRVLDNLLFTHIPVHPRAVGRFRANVHGHTHHHCYDPPYLNICVEQTDYAPLHFDEVRARVTALLLTLAPTLASPADPAPPVTRP